MGRTRSLALLLAVCLLMPALAAAQTTAVIQGRVSDESGAAVPGAAVTARNTDTGATRSTATDASGQYRIVGLPVGPYEIRAELAGFTTQVRAGVVLTVGSEVSVDFGMKMAPQQEVVTVTAETPIVETTKTSLGATITTRQIDDLPVVGRSFTNLAFLSPGILVNASTGGTGIAAAGGTGRNNTFLIDGFSNDDDAVASTRGEFALDSIREFQVLSNQFSAEYGQAAGAVINVLTRSGTNDLEGRLYTYYRADDLAANDPFVPINPTTGERPKAPFTEKTFGGFLGGPLRKDRTFFFASIEQTLRDETSVISVPAALLSAHAQESTTNFPNDIKNPRVLAKVDHNLGSDHTLTLRYRLDRDTRNNWYIGGSSGDGRSTAERGTDRLIENQDIAATHNWVVSPSVLNEFRLQFARRELNWDVSAYCEACPTINRPGILLGKMSNMPQGRTEDRWQLVETLSWNVLDKGGDHYFKAGADASFINLVSVFHNNLNGTFTFNTDAAFNPADRATYPIQFTRNQGDPEVELNNNIYALFLQDQWRITPHFTLNLGVRWDYEDVVGIEQDKNNLGPRVHFAWDPFKDGRTSIRGGWGRYFDQVFLNIPLNAENAKKFVGVTIANPGYPDPFVGGTVSTPPPPSTVVFDPELETPYNDTLSLGFQREIFRDLAVTADLVYAEGKSLLVTLDQNYSINGSPRANPNFSIMRMVKSEGRSEYKALQLGVVKRLSHRYSFNLSYTLADSKRNTEDFNFNPVDHRNLDAEWGPSFSDARHTLGGHVAVEAPWGFKVGMGGRYRTALPYNETTGNDDNRDGFVNDRPAGVTRNARRGADVWVVDTRLSKAVKIKETKLEAIVEAFNAFNHPSQGGFIGNRRSALFGKPTATVANFRPRQVQLGLRFEF